MGRTFLFECSRCTYRAYVAGGTGRGLTLAVKTICCLDCKELYDAVTGLKEVAAPNTTTTLSAKRKLARPPTFEAALSRLPSPANRRLAWKTFPLLCPANPKHWILEWRQPGKCPRCGTFLDASPIPFRHWE